MADFHKAIAKAIKAKGLQKLRFWCELCHKQCRDACGYNNHCTTEGHLRQVRVFSENANRFLDQYSREFEKDFMELIRRRFRFKTILAKKVYNEFIQDREHIHMNATRWVTLTDFVAYLGRSGLCEVTPSDQGWLIRYIDRDPNLKAQQEALRRKEKSELNAEERSWRRIQEQMKASQLEQDDEDPIQDMDPNLDNNNNNEELINDQKIGIQLQLHPRPNLDWSHHPPSTSFSSSSQHHAKEKDIQLNSIQYHDQYNRYDDRDDSPAKRHPFNGSTLTSISHQFPILSSLPPTTSTTLDHLVIEEESRKERLGRMEYWIQPDLMVKIKDSKLRDGKFFNSKAKILSVEEKYLATVRILDRSTQLKIHQADLETVIPNINGMVMIVNGAYRGKIATLVQLDIKAEKAQVKIAKGLDRGKLLYKDYDDICKYQPEA